MNIIIMSLIVVIDYAQEYTGMYRNKGEQTVIRENTRECTGMYGNILVYSRVLPFITKARITGIHRNSREFTEIHRNTQEHAGIKGSAREYTVVHGIPFCRVLV